MTQHKPSVGAGSAERLCDYVTGLLRQLRENEKRPAGDSPFRRRRDARCFTASD